MNIQIDDHYFCGKGGNTLYRGLLSRDSFMMTFMYHCAGFKSIGPWVTFRSTDDIGTNVYRYHNEPKQND